MAFLQLSFIVVALGLVVTAVRWIRSRPADDPALDVLWLALSPLLWLVRRARGPRD